LFAVTISPVTVTLQVTTPRGTIGLDTRVEAPTESAAPVLDQASRAANHAGQLTRAAADVAQGSVVRIASLADVIRSKQAANRPKDQRVLPTLRRLRFAPCLRPF
jgi:hypothetical protein